MNMKKYVTLILSGLLLLFAACDRTNDISAYEDSSLKVVSADVLFGSGGGQGYIVVDHPRAVTATSSATWCTVSVNGPSISVNVTAHTNLASRHALVTLKEGNQVNFVTVSQSGISFTIEKSTATISATGGNLRIGYESDSPPTVSSTVDWITGTADHANRQIVLTVSPYFIPNVTRQAPVTLIVGVLSITITVVQESYVPSYNEFLGTYTMTYSTSSVEPPTRNKSTTVTLVAAVNGTSYYLKGILAPADEALGNIVITFAKGLDIRGQLLFTRAETNYAFWLLPLGLNVDGGLVSSFASSTSLGMVSTNLNVTATGMSFSMIDGGGWGTSRVIGFRLRNYSGTTASGDIPGANGDASYFFPIFEKQ